MEVVVETPWEAEEPAFAPLSLAEALYVLDEVDAIVRWETQGVMAPVEAWQALRHIWRTQKVKERLDAIG